MCVHAHNCMHKLSGDSRRVTLFWSHPVDISGFTPARRSKRDQRKLHHTSAGLGNVTASARQQTPAAFFQHPFEVQCWMWERRQEHIQQRLWMKVANARNMIEVTFHRSEMRMTASPWLLEATPWPSASSRVRNLTLGLSNVTMVNALVQYWPATERGQ